MQHQKNAPAKNLKATSILHSKILGQKQMKMPRNQTGDLDLKKMEMVVHTYHANIMMTKAIICQGMGTQQLQLLSRDQQS